MGGEKVGGERIGMAYVDLTADLSPLKIALNAAMGLITNWAIQAQAELDTSMRNIWTIAGDASEQQLRRYEDNIIAMSRRIPQTAKQLADAYYQLLSANVATADALSVLEVSAKAASAGLTDTTVAVDALTTVINAYGLEANKAGIISDIMFKTVEKGKITYEQLAHAMGGVISTAASAGISFEEVAAAFATMTRAGISADEASTALNATLLAFIRPSDEAKELAAKMGIEFNLSALQTKGLAGALKDLNDATDGNTEKMTKFVPNVRALKGVLNLTRNEMKDYTDDLDIMNSSLGATDAAFEKQADSLENNIKKMKNAFGELAISIGKSLEPAVRSVTDVLGTFTKAFAALPERTQTVVTYLTIAISSFGLLQKAVSALTTSLTGPLGWVAAIGIAIAAIVNITEKVRDWSTEAIKAADKQNELINKFYDAAEKSGIAAKGLEGLIKKYEELAGKATLNKDEQQALNDVIKAIGDIAPGVISSWDDIGRAIGINIDGAKAKLKELYTAQKSYSQMAYNAAQAQIKAMTAAAMKAEAEVPKLYAKYQEIEPYYMLGSVPSFSDKAVEDRMLALGVRAGSGLTQTMDEAIAYIAGSDKAFAEAIYEALKHAPEQIAKWSKLSFDEQLDALFTLARSKAKEGQKILDSIADYSQSIAEFRKLEAQAAKASAEILGLDETINKLGEGVSTGTGGKGGNGGGGGEEEIEKITSALMDLTNADIVLDALDNIRKMIDIPQSTTDRLWAVVDAIEALERSWGINDYTVELRRELLAEIKLRDEANKRAKLSNEYADAHLDTVKQTKEEYEAYWDAYADLERADIRIKEQDAIKARSQRDSQDSASGDANAEAEKSAEEVKAALLKANEEYWDAYAEMEKEEIYLMAQRSLEKKATDANIQSAAEAANDEAEKNQLDAQEAALKANEAYWDAYAQMEIEENYAREQRAIRMRETSDSINNAATASDEEAQLDALAAKEAALKANEAYWDAYAQMEKEEIYANEQLAIQKRIAEQNVRSAAEAANAEVEQDAKDHQDTMLKAQKDYWDEYADMELEEIYLNEQRAKDIRAEKEAVWDEYAAMEKEEIRLKEKNAAAARELAAAEKELADKRTDIANSFLSGNIDAVQGIGEGLWNSLLKAVSGDFSPGAEGAFEAVEAIFSPFAEFSKRYWQGIFKEMETGAGLFEAIDLINASFMKKIEASGMKIASTFTELGKRMKESGFSMINGMGSKIEEAGKGLGGAIGSFIDAIGPILAAFDMIGLIVMAIKAIWDIGKAIWNWITGKKKQEEDEAAKRAGIQINEITGPMRDSIVMALDPLKALHNLGGYKDEVVAAIREVRNAMVGASAGVSSAREGIEQTFNISTIYINAANGETFSEIMRDLDRHARLAYAGAGG